MIEINSREYEEKLISVLPSPRQVAFQQIEFYAFVHFTVNTFTDREWGDGKENPEIFNPVNFDADQWLSAIKAAGMKGLILTCKHHDGFCLWPSKFTNHSVAASPFKKDIVLEVSEACKKYGIKFGVYLSPWDRNSSLYGQGKAYDDYFVNQLTELLTNYGPVFSVWFDGACGEGPNGKKQYYDWERYYKVIRDLQPDACISVCGPDIRWCGNEAGYTRESEWSVVPQRARDSEKIAEKSQQQDDEKFRLRHVDARDSDLGSRKILQGEENLIWYPAEVNTSIRPGWFYHEYEDDKVKSLEELVHVYMNSVGGNASFLLNIPPAKDGLFHKNDVKRLKELGDYLKKTFAKNIGEKADFYADAESLEACTEERKIDCLKKDDYEASYSGKADKLSSILIRWKEKVSPATIVIKENILKSQRVEQFEVQALINNEFVKIYSGTVIGYKKIIQLQKVQTDCLKIIITQCRREPFIAFVGIYE